MKEKLLGILWTRRGRENAIPAAELAARLGTDTRKLQDLITELRQAGEPIGKSCSVPRHGYFFCSTEEELAEQWNGALTQARRIINNARGFTTETAHQRALGGINPQLGLFDTRKAS